MFAIDLALLDQRLDDFLDEKGIAFGLAVQRGDEVLGDGFGAEKRGEQRARVGVGQTSERDARRQAFTVPFDERGGERVGAVQFGLAVSGKDEHTVVAQVAQQVVQQRQRSLICPVHIVDEDEQTAVAGERSKEARSIVEQAQSLFTRRQRRVGLERAELRLDFRSELGDLGCRCAQRCPQLFRALPVRPFAKRFDERHIGRRRFVLVTSAA